MDEIVIIFGLLIGLVVAIILIIILALLYSERKEATFYSEESRKLMQLLSDGKINQETYERLRIKLEREITYRKELEHLESALGFEKIDQGTYERMKKELREKYQEAE